MGKPSELLSLKDPEFDSPRDDPRYAELLSRVGLHLNRIRRKIARVEEKITEVGRPSSVRLRARPEAVSQRQSGLMLRALSCCGNSHSKDRREAISVNLSVDRTES